MPFARPPEVPLGKTWRRFEGRVIDGRSPKKYLIRDLEPKEKEECIKMTVNSFLRDEPLCAVLDILNDPSSVNTIISNWREFIDDQLTLACFEDDGRNGGMAAGHIICQVMELNDDEVDFDIIKGDQWKKLLKTLLTIDQSFDVFEHYGVKRFFSIHVVSVEPNHRGQNIGVELFKAAESLSRALQIPVISTVCTAVASQTVANKSDFNLLHVFPYKNMLAHGIDLSSCSTQDAKVYGKVIA